jgi:hypothetical protein
MEQQTDENKADEDQIKNILPLCQRGVIFGP